VLIKLFFSLFQKEVSTVYFRSEFYLLKSKRIDETLLITHNVFSLVSRGLDSVIMSMTVQYGTVFKRRKILQ
jgi:hypothetical protein